MDESTLSSPYWDMLGSTAAWRPDFMQKHGEAFYFTLDCPAAAHSTLSPCCPLFLRLPIAIVACLKLHYMILEALKKTFIFILCVSVWAPTEAGRECWIP